MHWPKWTLRELLVAVAWICVGLALAKITVVRLHAASGAAIGMGIGTILRRRWVCALLGIITALFIFGV
jgi:hypothetical protein